MYMYGSFVVGIELLLAGVQEHISFLYRCQCTELYPHADKAAPGHEGANELLFLS